MTISNFDWLLACSWPAVLMFCFWQRLTGHEDRAWYIAYGMLWLFLILDIMNLIIYLSDRNWQSAGIWLVNLALTVWALHANWRNKRRKKVTDALGAKSRALRDKLAEKMRDTMPRPAPVPVPVRA